MTTRFKDLKHKGQGDPASEARIAEYTRAIDDALALAELRRERELTQSDVAAVLGVTQVNISRIERQDDLYVSTLREYVEAMGGTLELRAVFPERAVQLDVPAGTAQ
jgi:DNA-binding XRE family transcriptional regulator